MQEKTSSEPCFIVHIFCAALFAFLYHIPNPVSNLKLINILKEKRDLHKAERCGKIAAMIALR
jgi:hypothetical protein